MTSKYKKDGGGGAHEIVNNFADSCEWFLGEMGIFLKFLMSTCPKTKYISFNHMFSFNTNIVTVTLSLENCFIINL